MEGSFFFSVNCAKSNSKVESRLGVVLRWLWEGEAGLFLALPSTICDPGQVFLLVCSLCHGSFPQFGR